MLKLTHFIAEVALVVIEVREKVADLRNLQFQNSRTTNNSFELVEASP